MSLLNCLFQKVSLALNLLLELFDRIFGIVLRAPNKGPQESASLLEKGLRGINESEFGDALRTTSSNGIDQLQVARTTNRYILPQCYPALQVFADDGAGLHTSSLRGKLMLPLQEKA